MNTDRFKFRVWDNINRRYCKDLPLLDKDGDLCYGDGNKYCNGEHQEDFTIEQCTGVRDKNGKLIYEGDIVRYNYPGSTPNVVDWNPKTCRWVVRLVQDVDMAEAASFCDDGILPTDGYIIVGNIHE